MYRVGTSELPASAERRLHAKPLRDSSRNRQSEQREPNEPRQQEQAHEDRERQKDEKGRNERCP